MQAVTDSHNGRKNLQIDGWNSGGKTGTAQLANAKCKCYKGYVTSYVGVAPMDDPQLLTYVVVTDPKKGASGTTVAAPVVKSILQYALPRYSIPQTTTQAHQEADRVGPEERAALGMTGFEAPGARDAPREGARRERAAAAGRASDTLRWVVSGDVVEAVAVRLDELFALPETTAVTGMTLDSRLVGPGDVYVALPGRTHHGAEFAGQAVARGAVAVLTDAVGARSAGVLDRPVVVDDDPRHAMAGAGRPDLRRAEPVDDHVRHHRHQRQDHDLVPGGRGAGGGRPARRRDRDDRVPARRFPGRGRPDHRDHAGVPGAAGPAGPDARPRRGLPGDGGRRRMRSRWAGSTPSVSTWPAFTNFGRDHLDFHGDLESYFEAKAALFTADRTRAAVVNLDDPRGARAAAPLRCRRARLPDGQPRRPGRRLPRHAVGDGRWAAAGALHRSPDAS